MNINNKELDTGIIQIPGEINQKILFISNLFGDFTSLERLIKRHGAKAVIHTGSFGFHTKGSIHKMSERLLRHLIDSSTLMPSERKSLLLAYPPQLLRDDVKIEELTEFPEYLAGIKKFSVPIYTIYGSTDDISVLENLTCTHNIDNLYFIDQQYSPVLKIGEVNIRFFGLGGAFIRNKLFDHGSGNSYITGSEDGSWVTLLQIGELTELGFQNNAPSEVRILLSHTNPSKEPIISQLASSLKADFVLTPNMEPRVTTICNWNFKNYEIDLFREKLIKSRDEFLQVWEIVRSYYEDKARIEHKRLAQVAVSLLNIIPSYQSNKQYVINPFKNILQLDAPSIISGYIGLNIHGHNIGFEAYSRGIDFSHRSSKVTSSFKSNDQSEKKSNNGKGDSSSKKQMDLPKIKESLKNKANRKKGAVFNSDKTDDNNDTNTNDSKSVQYSRKESTRYSSLSWHADVEENKPKGAKKLNNLGREALDLSREGTDISLEEGSKDKESSKEVTEKKKKSNGSKLNLKNIKSSSSNQKMNKVENKPLIIKNQTKDGEPKNGWGNPNPEIKRGGWSSKGKSASNGWITPEGKLTKEKWSDDGNEDNIVEGQKIKIGAASNSWENLRDDYLNKNAPTNINTWLEQSNETQDQVPYADDDWASKVSDEERNKTNEKEKAKGAENLPNIIWVDENEKNNEVFSESSRLLYLNTGVPFVLDEEFYGLFKDFTDKVKKIYMFKNKSFSLVEFDEQLTVNEASKALNYMDFKGRKLQANPKKDRVPRKSYFYKHSSTYLNKGYNKDVFKKGESNGPTPHKTKYYFTSNSKYLSSKQQWRDFAKAGGSENTNPANS